jgi:hypothetical protein
VIAKKNLFPNKFKTNGVDSVSNGGTLWERDEAGAAPVTPTYKDAYSNGNFVFLRWFESNYFRHENIA